MPSLFLIERCSSSDGICNFDTILKYDSFRYLIDVEIERFAYRSSFTALSTTFLSLTAVSAKLVAENVLELRATGLSCVSLQLFFLVPSPLVDLALSKVRPFTQSDYFPLGPISTVGFLEGCNEYADLQFVFSPSRIDRKLVLAIFGV